MDFFSVRNYRRAYANNAHGVLAINNASGSSPLSGFESFVSVSGKRTVKHDLVKTLWCMRYAGRCDRAMADVKTGDTVSAMAWLGSRVCRRAKFREPPGLVELRTRNALHQHVRIIHHLPTTPPLQHRRPAVRCPSATPLARKPSLRTSSTPRACTSPRVTVPQRSSAWRR